MTTPKPRSRAARKLTQKKAGIGTAPAFRQLRDELKRQYLLKIKSVDDLIEEYESSINLPWMSSEYLKRSREEVNLSQQQLADVSGVSRLVIANYESGVSVPTIENAEKIYTALEELGSDEAGRALMDVVSLSHLITLKAKSWAKGEINSLSAYVESMEAQGDKLEEERRRYQDRITQRAIARAAKGKK